MKRKIYREKFFNINGEKFAVIQYRNAFEIRFKLFECPVRYVIELEEVSKSAMKDGFYKTDWNRQYLKFKGDIAAMLGRSE